MAYRRMWWIVPCTSKRSLRTESRKDIEEILKTKLSTIKEEPGEMRGESKTPPRRRRLAKKGKTNTRFKVKMGRFFAPQFDR